MMADEDHPYIVEDRRMLSRVSGDRIKITHTIEPGQRETGCVTCCHAPDSCPACAILPCFDHPQYIVNEVNASRYVYVRENSLEWNSPELQMDRGDCCGRSLTDLIVQDQVRVLYFDDVHFDEVRNDTRCCNSVKTFCCGGNGEQVQIESTFCCGMCLRGRSICCACVPSCCPTSCCPYSVAKEELMVENAESAKKRIMEARNNARKRLQFHKAGRCPQLMQISRA